MTRWAMVADLRRCVGCQTCTAACKQKNATPPGVQWRRVVDLEVGEYPQVKRAFVPMGCMHCDDPPCMTVCPSTATGKRADGIVTIDPDLCIGCAYCAVACPYDARFKIDGIATKCTFCVERIDCGLAAGLKPGVDPEATPACVNSCIAKAMHFGDADDPSSNISRLLAENPGLNVEINLSGASAGDDQLLKLIPSELDDSGADPSRLIFEITETAAISNLSRVVHFMQALKALGCKFSLDDFGSGLSSFTYLKNLPVDYLKIDGAYTRNVTTDQVNQEMVSAMIKLARTLDEQKRYEGALLQYLVSRFRYGLITLPSSMAGVDVKDRLSSVSLPPGVDHSIAEFFLQLARATSADAGAPPASAAVILDDILPAYFEVVKR